MLAFPNFCVFLKMFGMIVYRKFTALTTLLMPEVCTHWVHFAKSDFPGNPHKKGEAIQFTGRKD